jgi:hypothetical protein
MSQCYTPPLYVIHFKGGLDSGEAQPCRQVRKLGTEKLAVLESTIRELQTKRRDLKRTLSKWDELLKHTPHGKRAGLLEMFARSKEKST